MDDEVADENEVPDEWGTLAPRGSKYPIFEASGSKNHTLNGILGPGSYIGYLDPLG